MHISGNCQGYISVCLATNFCEIQGWFYLVFPFFQGFSFKFFNNFWIFDSEFYSIYWKGNFMVSIKVIERYISGILGFWAKHHITPPDSFQGFQGLLDTMHLQEKLVSYFHSKSSTIWLILITRYWTCHLFIFWVFKNCKMYTTALGLFTFSCKNMKI